MKSQPHEEGHVLLLSSRNNDKNRTCLTLPGLMSRIWGHESDLHNVTLAQ